MRRARVRKGCRLCGTKDRTLFDRGHRICTPCVKTSQGTQHTKRKLPKISLPTPCIGCGGDKPKVQGSIYCTTCKPPRHKAKAKRDSHSKYLPHDPVLAYHLLADLYKLQGLNTRGESPKVGWTQAQQGLTANVKIDPILDPDYIPPETPDRLTVREMRELL